MNIHDYFADELFEKKSMAACYFLIKSGRELEFVCNDKECFISSDGSCKKYSLWVDNVEQTFESIDDMMLEAVIGDKKLYEAWPDIVLIGLF